MVEADRCHLCICLEIDVYDRKIVDHAECLDCIVPFAHKSVRIYGTLCISSVEGLSVKVDGVVC